MILLRSSSFEEQAQEIHQPVIKVRGKHFTIFKDEQGYFAQCDELPHCVTHGETKQELWKNIRNTLKLCGE